MLQKQPPRGGEDPPARVLRRSLPAAGVV